ncbi:hypothetical protein ACFVJS_08755 [Nocardioides sp. NPDC057772]|uniref:hypothetical protein n=1 Tax=Nocardioides sp. NPDC057772 TaxID=3346245 RepID=UPI00366BFD7E
MLATESGWVDALRELVLDGGDRYLVVSQSSLATAGAPDTREAEKLVADLQERWALDHIG